MFSDGIYNLTIYFIYKYLYKCKVLALCCLLLYHLIRNAFKKLFLRKDQES